jgi:hypothetical protein
MGGLVAIPLGNVGLVQLLSIATNQLPRTPAQGA